MPSRARAALSTLFWAVVGVASFVLGVLNPVGQQAEERVLTAAEFTTAPPPPLNLISPVSIALVLAVLGLIALASYGWRRALGIILVSGVTIVASQLLKSSLLRRPDLLYDAPNTFPSGHMTVFVVLVVAMVWAVPAVIRPWVTFGGAVLLCIASWQLLEYGWHRPSDVYGAIALGTAAFALASLIRPLRTGKRVAVSVPKFLFMSALLLAVVTLCTLAYAGIAESGPALLLTGQFGAFAVSALSARTAFTLSTRP